MLHRILLTIVAAPLMFAAAVNYSYDAAGRLIRADYGTGGSIAYTYDNAGNLLSRIVINGATAGGTITSVNTAGSPASAGIAPNAWLEIKGTNLVPASTPTSGVTWGSAPDFAQGKMPANLNGISATVDGKPAYIYFFCAKATGGCSQDQVNALAPIDNTTGPVQVVVSNNGVPSAPFTVTMNPAVPSFLLFSPQGYIVGTHLDFVTLLGPATLFPGLTQPAAINETVILYGVGFGLPTNTLTPGSSSQSGSMPSQVICKVGGNVASTTGPVLITPGLYQINLTIPSGSSSGDNALSCSYNGLPTPAGDLVSVK